MEVKEKSQLLVNQMSKQKWEDTQLNPLNKPELSQRHPIKMASPNMIPNNPKNARNMRESEEKQSMYKRR